MYDLMARPRERWHITTMVRPDFAAGKTVERTGTQVPDEPFLGPDGVATLLLSLLVMAASFGLTLATALGQVILVARRVSTHPPADARWLVVLGTCLEGDRPGAAFRARLDRARMLAEHRPGLKVAVLGGSRIAGAPAEGSVGLRYLRAAGLAPDRLAAETRSRHTLENLRALRAGFAADNGTHDILLVTSRSHLARAVVMAAGLGLSITPCAAEDTGRLPARELARLPVEAFLLHWYLVGRCFARLTRNRRMLRRIA